MADTAIEWTEKVWNPIVGCTVHSPGCTNCYAMRMAWRLQGMAAAGNEALAHYAGTVTKTKAGPVWTGKIGIAPDSAFLAPLHRRTPTTYFVNSMSDLFHKDVPDEVIDRVFAVMALCPQHIFQVLTKRSARMREYCGDPATPFRVAKAMASISGRPTGPEEVRPVEGFPGYFVSSHGYVYSERRGPRKRLRPDAGDQGHLRVPLFRDGGPRRGYRVLVHHLVLEAFDGPAPSMDAQGRHLDSDPSNNTIGNLEWGGQSANWDDSKRHGSFRRYSKLSPADVLEIRRRASTGEAAYSIAKDYPVSDTQVRNIVSGEQWSIEPPIAWPLGNVWKGVSVEDQARGDERIPDLLATPAVVRWISAEPLLGPVDLRWIAEPDEDKDGVIDALLGCNWVERPGDEFQPVRPGHQGRAMGRWVVSGSDEIVANRKLDWVVAGGESGPGARGSTAEVEANMSSLLVQCRAAGVSFFGKQNFKKLPLPADLDVKEYPT